jgi:DNA-binding transcriptional LysR family regulator
MGGLNEVYSYEYFLEVAEKMSFTAASKSLFLSQPALSKQISLLEEELGVKLFHRLNKKIELTQAGRQFKKDLLEISVMMEKAKKNAKKAGEKEELSIHVECFDGMVMEDFFPKFLEILQRVSPQGDIKIGRKAFDQLRAALQEDKADIIITLDFELPDLHEYHCKKLQERKTALIYSNAIFSEKKEIVTFEDFFDKRLIVINPDVSTGCYKQALAMAEKIGVKKPAVDIVDNFQTAITYLEMGYGYLFLAEEVTKKYDFLKKLEMPFEKKTDVVAVWKRDRKLISEIMDNY